MAYNVNFLVLIMVCSASMDLGTESSCPMVQSMTLTLTIQPWGLMMEDVPF